uniref:Uncharacterized protein n=1 Tax=Opuntia streptacantha TaxID=393608 RepID=A0A7C9DDA5_OPUST
MRNEKIALNRHQRMSYMLKKKHDEQLQKASCFQAPMHNIIFKIQKDSCSFNQVHDSNNIRFTKSRAFNVCKGIKDNALKKWTIPFLPCTLTPPNGQRNHLPNTTNPTLLHSVFFIPLSHT